MSDLQNPQPTPSATITEPPLEPRRSSGLGLASLIVGGVALLFSFIPFINYVSGLIAVVGIVLGIVALVQKGRKKPLAIAGTIVSVVALVLSVVLAVAYTAGFAAAVDDAVGGAAVIEPTPGGADAGDTPEDAPVAETPASDAGTRENPLPLGTEIELTSIGGADYRLTPGASTLNANDVVAAENPFNEAAPAGSQYALLPLSLTYVGSETGNPFVDIQVSFVSADGNTYEQYDTAVVGPAPLTGINELFPDASAQGNVVIAIPTAGAEQGVWSISSLFGDPVYFAAQ